MLAPLLAAALIAGCAQTPVTTGNTAATSEPALECLVFDQTDQFTGKRVVSSGPYRMYSERLDLRRSTLRGFVYEPSAGTSSSQLYLSVFAMWDDGERQLGLQKQVRQVSGYLEFTAQDDPDPKIGFLLSNGEAVDVRLSAAGPETLTDGGWVTQVVFGDVSDSIWQQLKEFPPTMMRIRYRGPEISIFTQDFAIDTTFQNRIPFALKCIDDLELP